MYAINQKQLDKTNFPPATLATNHSALPIYTVRQFSFRNPAFTESALRNLIFKADIRKSSIGDIEGNGLIESGAIVRVGRKILINEEKFFEWLLSQNSNQGE